MMPPPTLVIMAAGAARRYGDLKQLAPVGPDGEALMEYSVYDALRAGFGKVVLVVRREFESAFREKFTDRAGKHIEVALSYQDSDAFVPQTYEPIERSKPWGTAHAVLCAKPAVPAAFAVMNADDFYGQGAIETIGGHLAGMPGSDTEEGSQNAAMVGYALGNTLSDHGTVNRGVCEVDASGCLKNIVERFEIARDGNAATCQDTIGNSLPLAIDTVVSMNLWGFSAGMLAQLEQGFCDFLATGPDASTEYELPTFVKQLMTSGAMSVRVLPTSEKWCGMTYQEDLPAAQSRIAQLVDRGVYPQKLW